LDESWLQSADGPAKKSQKKFEKRVAFLRAALHNNPRVEEVANMVGVAQLAERLTVMNWCKKHNFEP
jgi:hypothetical protein